MLKLYVRRAIVGQLNLIDEIPTLEYLNVNYAQVVQTCVIEDHSEANIFTLDKGNKMGVTINPELSPGNNDNLKKSWKNFRVFCRRCQVVRQQLNTL